jgi:hypothetical protein
MAKKKPYVPPKVARYESLREVPSKLRSASESLRNEAEERFRLHVAPDYTAVVDTERRVRPDCQIDSNMELVRGGSKMAKS